MIYNILNTLRSRLALNILFWAVLSFIAFYINFYSDNHTVSYPLYWYQLFRCITLLLLAGLLYANNLWLLPQYLVKRKYFKYFALTIGLAYITGIFYSLLFTYLDHHFPLMSVTDVSIFSTFRIVDQSSWAIAIEALSWMVTFCCILFVFSMAWYMRDYSRQKRIVEQVQKKQVETELAFLRSQLNPHFLFNTLNNLYSLTIKKSDRAPEIISKLSNILRFLLYESNQSRIDFNKEKIIMHDYIDLELLRLSTGNKLNFSITADGDYFVPPLLWLPVLENLFKHGTRFISNQYSLEYSFSIVKNVVHIYSKNTFKASLAGEKKETGEGIGIVNLKKRLALIYPNKYKITTETENEYFITRVQIELD